MKTYLLLLLVMQAGLMGMFASVDVFFFYFFHELALIPTFIMVGVWAGRDRTYAAMTMTIYLTLGAMLSLLGPHRHLREERARAASTSWRFATRWHRSPRWARSPRPHLRAPPLRFGILVSLWPFHSWAPLGYGAAPELGGHAARGRPEEVRALRPHADRPAAPAARGRATGATLAALAAVGNVLVIGLVTMAQRDLKQMVGYSSVMHMGYAFLGIAAGSVLGVGGVVMLMVGHGLSVALLFLLSTSIHQRTQTFDMERMGGLAQKAPVLAALFVAATFASIGLPGFANFWGELPIFFALWNFSHALTVVALTGTVIRRSTACAPLQKVFFGTPSDSFARWCATQPPPDITWSEKLPALVLVAVMLFVGIWPRSLSTGDRPGARGAAAAAAAR